MQQTVVACGIVEQRNDVPACCCLAFHVLRLLLHAYELLQRGVGFVGLVVDVIAPELCTQGVCLRFQGVGRRCLG